MSLDVPMIVIPNPLLQDNHQLELASELQRQRYALHGDLKYVQHPPPSFSTLQPTDHPPPPQI